MSTVNIDIELLKENLKQKGYKLTPQRRAIVDVIIEKEGEHLTAEEIYDEVKKICPDIQFVVNESRPAHGASSFETPGVCT